MKHEIRYGKADVKVYRTHAEPLTGITRIPESPFATWPASRSPTSPTRSSTSSSACRSSTW